MELKIILPAFTLDKYTEAKVPEQMLDVIFVNESQCLGRTNGQARCQDITFPLSRTPLKNVAIKNFKVLYPNNSILQAKEIREITLDFQHYKGLDWQPGDTIAILPSNANEHVQDLLKILELESKADTACSVVISKSCTKKAAKAPPYIPMTTTPREILRDCLNLKSVLKKTFLRSLAEYCSDNEEKTFLKCISSKEGSSIYNDFIIKSGFTLVDILKLCRTCKPPFCLIVENMSRLLPRPYSIANSPLERNDEITIIFSTLDVNPGVTTNMLKEKCNYETSSLLIYIRETNYFRYTENDYQQNQILIAIGTGLSPFLGFLQHKQHLMHKNKKKPGCTWLFVGTSTQQSVIHRDDLLKWQSKNVLNRYIESFSRNRGSRFHYVQDALNDNAKQLVNLLMDPETYLYLCADGAQISKSIEKSLQDMLSKELAISEEESIQMLKDFKTKRKYREDIWY